MGVSISRPQDQSGKSPANAFWKALAMAGILNLVGWSAILYWIGFKAAEWDLYLIFFSVTFLLTLLGLYRGYNNRNWWTKKTPGRQVGSAVFWGLLGFFWLVCAFLDRHRHRPWDFAWELALAVIYILNAARDLRKASQPEATKILPI